MIRRNGGKIERNESTCSALRNGATTKLCYTLRVLNYLRNVYNALLPSLQEVRVKFLIAFTSFQFVRGVCFSSLNTFNIFGCFHSKCRLFLKTLLPSRVKYLSLHRQRTMDYRRLSFLFPSNARSRMHINFCRYNGSIYNCRLHYSCNYRDIFQSRL